MFYKNDKINNDFSQGNDYFNGQEYANDIVEALKNDDIKSIGLYGKWGIGKTSIIENAIKIVLKEGLYEEINIIKYNAWKYNKCDFMRDFLIECSKQIEGEDAAKEKEYSYYNDRTEETHFTRMLWKSFINFLKESWSFFSIVVLGFVGFTVLILYIDYLNPNLYECEDILVPIIVALIGFILPIFVVSNVSCKNISKKFSPEQFSRDFDEITKKRKMLVFIDDIDRCSSDEIKDTFDILKTFILSKSNDIKFIIPIDPNVLYSTLGDKTYDYFSKIIDYPIIIKKYETFSFNELKKSIMNDVDSRYTSIINDGVYLASKYYIDTPRKFKKFINQFVNEIYKYEPRTIRQKGAMFSKLIILKNEFPLYYESLITNYKLTKRISDEMISNYESDDMNHNDISIIIKGIKFDKRLLEFLSKTSNVDLYDFALYESNMSYEKYKIKLICEEPILRNAFDDDNKINLGKNIEFLEYELTTNIINPINDNHFLYSDLLRKICLIFNQFDSQPNYTKARNLLERIQVEKIKKDSFLLLPSVNNTREINWSYINESLKIYNYSKPKKSNDFIFKCLIEFIYEHTELITDDLDNLFDFVNIFKDEKNIENTTLISIISFLLEKDFNKYSPLMEWYFDNDYHFDAANHLSSIIDYIYSKGKNVCFIRYIENKYTRFNSYELLDDVINHINIITQKLNLYEEIIEHLTKVINLKNENFEKIFNFLYTLRFDSKNFIINNLVYRIIRNLTSTLGFEKDKYISIVYDFAKNYDGSIINLDMLQKIVNNSSIDVRNSLLDYNPSLDIFQNYDIVKGGIILDQSKKTIKSLINTYAHFEGKVYIEYLNGNNVNLLCLTAKDISKIVNFDINNMIYIISENNLDFENINIVDIDFETLEYDRIKNQKLVRTFIDFLYNNLIRISAHVLNNDNLDELKGQLDKYLVIFNHIVVDLNYTNVDIMRSFRAIERHMVKLNLYNTLLIPELDKYNQLVTRLLSDINYKSRNKNYQYLLETVNN